MSTATITLTATETGIITHAQQVLARLDDPGFPFPWLAQRSANVQICKSWLLVSVEDHAGVSAVPPRIHPESLFPDLGRHQDNVVEIALEHLAEDIDMNAGALILAIREACGTKAATYVSGSIDEGTWAA